VEEEVNERQLKYIEVLRATGNPSRARQAAGITRRQVSNWERDEPFSEAAEEAQSAALDEVVEASRTAALAGDSAQMTNWLKLARPELRAGGTQVAVQVNNRGDTVEEARRRRIAAMSDEELLEEFNRVLDDTRLRVEAQRDYESPRLL